MKVLSVDEKALCWSGAIALEREGIKLVGIQLDVTVLAKIVPSRQTVKRLAAWISLEKYHRH